MNTDETKTEVSTDQTETTETTEQTTDATVEVTADPLDAITDPDELRKAAKAQRSIAQRYKKAPPKIIKDVERVESVKPSDILRSPEFSLHREGYNEDEIDLIMRNGGRDILKNDKSPIVMGLKASREQRRAEEAASRAQDTSGMSELERKYTRADLEKMSVAELDKILPHAN